ncbi:MAG: hypothetical protein OXG82_05460 [Gammaproteobacteria bacterium]|nr:hypothetical protein [Gammaproteobacteria bacterium]
MGGRRTLGSGADRLEGRRTSRLLLAAPIIVAALALMTLGAVLAEFVADPSALAAHMPGWTAEVAVWAATLVVVGAVLILIQRRRGTASALLALVVLMAVALVAVSAGEVAAYLGWEPR